MTLPWSGHMCAGVIETGTEAEVAAQLKQETPEETAARLTREASVAKDNIRCFSTCYPDQLHGLSLAQTLALQSLLNYSWLRHLLRRAGGTCMCLSGSC